MQAGYDEAEHEGRDWTGGDPRHERNDGNVPRAPDVATSLGREGTGNDVPGQARRALSHHRRQGQNGSPKRYDKAQHGHVAASTNDR